MTALAKLLSDLSGIDFDGCFADERSCYRAFP